MVKNIKRYGKDLERGNNPLAEKDELSRYVNMDTISQTYIFPGEYNFFVEEFRRNPNATWIMKPSHKAQGQGIYLVTKLTQLKCWRNESKIKHEIKMADRVQDPSTRKKLKRWGAENSNYNNYSFLKSRAPFSG